MWKSEAIWINEQISRHVFAGNPVRCLNLGSSTREYREIKKPYINDLLIEPLGLMGSITNVDAKAQDGVDEVGDFCDRAFIDTLVSKKYDLVLCNNLLTHVKCRKSVFEIIDRSLDLGGYAIITAPSLYPYCADPYDAKYRPSTEDIEKSLPSFRVIASTILRSGETHANRLIHNPRLLVGFGLNMLLPAYGLKRWINVSSDLPNLFKSFETTCVVLQK